MSSRRGGGRPSNTANSDDSSSKGKSISQSNPNIEQLTQGIADTKLDSGQDDGQWEVYARKPKNRAGSSTAKQWGPPAHNSNPRPWGNTDMAQKAGTRNHGGVGRAAGNPWQTQNANYKRPAGRGNGRPQFATSGYENNNVTSNPLIRPPLEHGWNWQSRTGSMQSNVKDEIAPEELEKNSDVDDEGEDDCDALEDTDDDLASDDYDSEASQKSHETRKKSKWFRKFFEILDGLTVEQINDPERQWHCAACQGGPGAIDWYKGLQPLMTHAKTKGSKRVKMHRELAELLDEELRRRGTSVIPAGEAFGKWKGLKNEEKDHEIVWPPMVVVLNTQLELDENEKWIGMGNQELLDYFSAYAAVRARHSYGPQGHRGVSVLIFEASATGYLEAERLHKHFTDQGTDKDAWCNRRVLYLPGGNRQLYGYMATKEDLEFFNKHCQGKSRLKYDMRSYQEMVVTQIRQMSEDNQQLIYLKNKYFREKMHSKALEESFGIVTEKLRKTMEENRIVRRRTKTQHEEIKEEMDHQEQFFKDQIRIIHDSRNEKEEDFERIQQEERQKVKQSSMERRLKADEYLKFVKVQDKEMENFVAEKEKLCEAHEEDIVAMRTLYSAGMNTINLRFCHCSSQALSPTPKVSFFLPSLQIGKLALGNPAPSAITRKNRLLSPIRASMAPSTVTDTETKPFSVLFVCLGNICRSPAAEGVFTDLVKKRGLNSKFRIDSAGTINYHEGNEADPRMRAASKRRGIQITSISRPIKPSDFIDFDLILAMDKQNREDILEAFNRWKFRQTLPDDAHKKVKLMCSYCMKHDETEVPDPYYGGPQGFEKVLDLLEDACESLLENILAENKHIQES